MSEEAGRLQEMLSKLETERDELRVKLNLAKLEARDEWEELDKKLDSLRGRMKVLSSEAKEAGGDVGAAVETLAGEVREGFARIRRML